MPKNRRNAKKKSGKSTEQNLEERLETIQKGITSLTIPEQNENISQQGSSSATDSTIPEQNDPISLHGSSATDSTIPEQNEHISLQGSSSATDSTIPEQNDPISLQGSSPVRDSDTSERSQTDRGNSELNLYDDDKSTAFVDNDDNDISSDRFNSDEEDPRRALYIRSDDGDRTHECNESENDRDNGNVDQQEENNDDINTRNCTSNEDKNDLVTGRFSPNDERCRELVSGDDDLHSVENNGHMKYPGRGQFDQRECNSYSADSHRDYFNRRKSGECKPNENYSRNSQYNRRMNDIRRGQFDRPGCSNSGGDFNRREDDEFYPNEDNPSSVQYNRRANDRGRGQFDRRDSNGSGYGRRSGFNREDCGFSPTEDESRNERYNRRVDEPGRGAFNRRGARGNNQWHGNRHDSSHQNWVQPVGPVYVRHFDGDKSVSYDLRGGDRVRMSEQKKTVPSRMNYRQQLEEVSDEVVYVQEVGLSLSKEEYQYNMAMSRRNNHPARRSFNQNWVREHESELNYDRPNLLQTYGHTADVIIERAFTKKYEFKTHLIGKLDVGTIYKESKQDSAERHSLFVDLQEMKNNLNAVKQKLDEYNLNDWHMHTRSTNPAHKVMKYLRSEIKVEFLTQAWCKFYELVYSFQLVPAEAKKTRQLYSVHLCEAPGAFVASLNHYLKLNFPEIKWRWMANSLNPFYEGNHSSSMINDDRFMLQTLDCWEFGPDMTGDITHPDYPVYLRQKCLERFGGQLPHLVTADGSFDCQDKPEEQENSVAWLHLKEALNALNILRKGGNFVLKMFTFFELDTVCLLFLLNAAFQSVNIVKPATSKEGNSEVYVVCRDFKDNPEVKKYFQALFVIGETTHQEYFMLPINTISRLFTRQIMDCIKMFSTFQKNVIERNIRLFEARKRDSRMSDLINAHADYLQDLMFQEYVNKYDIRPLLPHEHIVSIPSNKRAVLKHTGVVESKQHSVAGSHSDQLKRGCLLAKDLLGSRYNDLGFKSFDPEKPVSKQLKDDKSPCLSTSDFKIETGKAIEIVRSSQFVHGRYMRIRNELINTYGIMKYNVWTMLRSASSSPADSEVNDDLICRVDEFPLWNDNNNEVQHLSFRKIFEKLLNVRENDDFTIVGQTWLTQFNVDVLFVLKQFFKEIVFENPNVIRLKRAKLLKRNEWMERLKIVGEEYDDRCHNAEAIICFLPVRCITGTDNDFYKWIVDVNNYRMMCDFNAVLKANSDAQRISVKKTDGPE